MIAMAISLIYLSVLFGHSRKCSRSLSISLLILFFHNAIKHLERWNLDFINTYYQFTFIFCRTNHRIPPRMKFSFIGKQLEWLYEKVTISKLLWLPVAESAIWNWYIILPEGTSSNKSNQIKPLRAGPNPSFLVHLNLLQEPILLFLKPGSSFEDAFGHQGLQLRQV